MGGSEMSGVGLLARRVLGGWIATLAVALAFVSAAGGASLYGGPGSRPGPDILYPGPAIAPPLASATAFRVTMNTLRDSERTAFTIALGDSPEARAWPFGAGVRSPARLFLTVHGSTAVLTDAATGAPVSPAPTASVNLASRQIDVRVQHAAWNPGTSVVRMEAGVG